MRRYLFRVFLFGALLQSSLLDAAWTQTVTQEATATTTVSPIPTPRVHGTAALYARPETQASLEQFRTLRAQKNGGPLVDTPTYTVGQQVAFKVFNHDTDQYDTLDFTLAASGNLSNVWVETAEFGSGKITQTIVNDLLDALENTTPEGSFDSSKGIVEVDQALFGNPPNINGSGKVEMLLTDIASGISGFFNPNDLNPGFSNSNGADIIYVDTTPQIYSGSEVSLEEAFGTIAHEYQHLIHATYGNLHIFQNEGQAEWAEQVCGYQPRAITFLNTTAEVNRYVYTWRSTSAVVNDYQRAGLLHAYLAERIGLPAVGSITRSVFTQGSAYQQALSGVGLTWGDVLSEFHVANWVNDATIDAKYGYQATSRSNIKVTEPTQDYPTEQESSGGAHALQYGGANYLRWTGVANFQITLTGDATVRFHFILDPKDGSGKQVESKGLGTHTFSGEYSSIVLVASNVEAIGGNENNPGTRPFNHGASWTSVGLAFEELSYAGAAQFFGELDATKNPFGLRFTPTMDGRVTQIIFPINGGSGAISGSGDLELILTESQNVNQGRLRHNPATQIASTTRPISSLASGNNVVDLASEDGWDVRAGEEFFILWQLTSSTARVELLLDGGSNNQSDPTYWPPRTMLFLPQQGQWAWFTTNNNLLGTITVIESEPVPIEAPERLTTALALHPNYPNPFTEETTLSFTLPETSVINLTIFDVLGRAVQVVTDGIQAAGAHHVLLRMDDLPSGLYIARLQSDTGTVTRSILRMR